MEKPNYVLKFNEGVLVPKNENPLRDKLKIAVWIIVGVIILGSIIFRDNLFSELSWTVRILLILLVVRVSFGGGSKRVPSPIELWFFDDYLIVYREKRYYSKKVTRKEFDKFYYKDIHRIQYRRIAQKVNIYGIVEGIWYNYDIGGNLPAEPTYHRTADSICSFYTTEEPDVDFVSEIEAHSPIKVIVEDN